jgi:hypothetical protein
MCSTPTTSRWRRRLVLIGLVGALVSGIAAYRSRALARAAERFDRTYGDP